MIKNQITQKLRATTIIALAALVTAIFISGCASTPPKPGAFEVVDSVDLDRFEGKWYVIAIIPNFIEENSVNGIETYEFEEDGDVKITYTFRKGSPDGEERVMHPNAWIHNRETNAEWRVQFIWPITAKYLIFELGDEYEYTVIGTDNYDFLWIMAREPQINDDLYQGILDRMQQRGFDPERIEKVPQVW